MPTRTMLLHLACVVSGLGVCLAGALMLEAAHPVWGLTFFAIGAAGVGLQEGGGDEEGATRRGGRRRLGLGGGCRGRRDRR